MVLSSSPSRGREVSVPPLLPVCAPATMSSHFPTARPQLHCHPNHPLPLPCLSKMPSLASARVSSKRQNGFMFLSASQTSASSCSAERSSHPFLGVLVPPQSPSRTLSSLSTLSACSQQMDICMSGSMQALTSCRQAALLIFKPLPGPWVLCFYLYSNTEFVEIVIMAQHPLS